VAVAVDEQVDAGGVGNHIDGAVAGALVIHAQVADAHNQVAARFLQRVNLRLRAGIQLLARGEGDAAHLVRMGLGHGLGGVQAEHAHLEIALFKDHMILEFELAADFIGDVGGQDGEVGKLGVLQQVVDAPVQLMIAGRHRVIARGVHEFKGGLAVVQVDQGRALGGVARIQQQHLRALSLQVLFHLRDGGIAPYAIGGHGAAMNIVGMQNN